MIALLRTNSRKLLVYLQDSAAVKISNAATAIEIVTQKGGNAY